MATQLLVTNNFPFLIKVNASVYNVTLKIARKFYLLKNTIMLINVCECKSSLSFFFDKSRQLY